jgi:hypothetical protein
VATISKRFELESWDWALSLHLFELFPIFGGRGKGGGGAQEDFVIAGVCNSRINSELVH